MCIRDSPGGVCLQPRLFEHGLVQKHAIGVARRRKAVVLAVLGVDVFAQLIRHVELIALDIGRQIQHQAGVGTGIHTIHAEIEHHINSRAHCQRCIHFQIAIRVV